MTNAYPSADPADDDSLLGTLRTILRKHLQTVDDMLPARVVAFNRTTNRVQVQILIKQLTTTGELVSRQQVASIPVFQIGGGDFILNFPLNPGDLGWIKAADRDISLFLQSYEETGPNSLTLHSFDNSVFFPDVMRGFTIDAEDASNVVLQTLDGSCRVAIWSDRVKVTAPLIVLDAPDTHVTGNLRVDGNISGGDDGSGNMTVNGNITVTGNVTADGEVTAAGIDLSTHTHGGVQSGGSNTGAPNP